MDLNGKTTVSPPVHFQGILNEGAHATGIPEPSPPVLDTAKRNARYGAGNVEFASPDAPDLTENLTDPFAKITTASESQTSDVRMGQHCQIRSSIGSKRRCSRDAPPIDEPKKDTDRKKTLYQPTQEEEAIHT